MHVDRNGLEILDAPECARLLAGTAFGRIAVSIGALPAILPVNFLLDGERILIRTGRGTKLHAAVQDAVVAFEVDHFDPFLHAGWSVCVTGKAGEIRDQLELAHIAKLPLPHWAPDDAHHVIAVSMDVVTGRRIVRP